MKISKKNEILTEIMLIKKLLLRILSEHNLAENSRNENVLSFSGMPVIRLVRKHVY